MPVGCLFPGQGFLLSGQIDLAQVLEQNGRGDDAYTPSGYAQVYQLAICGPE